MSQPRVDKVWRVLVGLFAEVLNPMLIIWLALFVCLGYILTLLMPVRIEHWTALLGATLLLSLAGLLLRFRRLWRAGSDESLGFDRRALLPLLPLLVFLPLFHAELTSPTLQILNHGDMHVGYVHQLLYHATPPENIFVPGHPANFYWLYHALLAALVKATGWAPPLVASLVNIISICSSFYWLARVLVALGLAKRHTLWLGLLIVLVYCAVNITGALTLLQKWLDGAYHSNSLRIMLLPGADSRLHSVMGKVMNFTSTAVGIMCFIASLQICLRFLRGKLDWLDLVLLSACVALCLAVRHTAALSIVVALLGGGAAVGFGLIFDRRAVGTPPLQLAKATIRRLRPHFVAIWLVISAFLSLPLLHYYERFIATNVDGFSVQLFYPANINMLGAALLVFLPLLALQTVYALRDRSWLSLFLPVSAWLGLLLTAVLILPNGDQHKAVYYVAILVALSALQILARSWDRGRIQPVKLFVLCLGALAIVKVGQVTRYYDARARQLEFVYDSGHITYMDGERMPAYTWIRENTPADAILVLPLTVHKYEHMLHERQVYVRKAQYWFTDNIPSYDRRVTHVQELLSMETTAADYYSIIDAMRAELPGRALYAVLADSDAALAVIMDVGAEMVYEGDYGGEHVYLLNP
ncbi:MAG: hypothetical protein OXE95_09870 [Chloroflexi bacterium]|nr:hypothetical protein [Chloroflexota bacterium]MCY4247866.1 hypothetical protein [Chloroflexota bacterium]